MSAEKLTKKQQKAAQFRNKIQLADSSAASDNHNDVLDLKQSKKKGTKTQKLDEKKEASIQAQGEIYQKRGGDDNEIASKEINGEKKKRKRKEVKEADGRDINASQVNTPDLKREGKKKKDREPSEEKEPDRKRSKKVFDDDGKVEEIEMLTAPAKEDTANEDDAKNDKRYIVFVGNMSFTSTTADIAKHFASHCSETSTVRLLTKKGDPSKLATLSKSKQKSIAKGRAADPSAPTSKGCAFIEFKSASALQKALQYHHTQFEGRTINVELTAGGGGKSDGRKEKIKKKNQELELERQKLHEKYVKNAPKKETKTEEKEVEKPAAPQWGPKAAANKQRATTKIPKWAASGANAVRLSG